MSKHQHTHTHTIAQPPVTYQALLSGTDSTTKLLVLVLVVLVLAPVMSS
jgi:hypothetical protein